jgi:hypothetical protein
VEGAAQQVKGKAEKAWGNVKDEVRDANRESEKERDIERDKENDKSKVEHPVHTRP